LPKGDFVCTILFHLSHQPDGIYRANPSTDATSLAEIQLGIKIGAPIDDASGGAVEVANTTLAAFAHLKHRALKTPLSGLKSTSQRKSL